MNKLINCILKKDSSCVPVWFMRQAGRYLPEFRKIRIENQDFIKLCLNSNLSSIITLQPINRFNLDAAIIFSDILMVPYALGQDVVFTKEYGPKLSNFDLKKFLDFNENDFVLKLKPIYDSIKITRKALDKKKSIISFVGSPWTLLIYILGLKDSEDKLKLDLFNNQKKEIDLLLEKLNKFLCLHIKKQIESGADIVQLFDTWAGLIEEKNLNKLCFEPNMKIVEYCKNNKIPVICFPKGLKKNYIKFIEIVKPNCVSIDYKTNPNWAKENFKGVSIQGGMDPKILLLEEKEIYKEAEKYLKIFKDYPYVFNLGHGILPSTNPDKVDKLVKFVKEYK